MRTGDEPSHARSPLRLRLALTVFGLASTVTGAVLLAAAGRPGWAIAFAAGAVVALVDLAVVIHRLRQGPHYQPGPRTPPYRPVDRERDPATAAQARARAPVRTRVRRYLVLMTLCVVLLLLGWIWVARYSTAAAVAITVVAMLL